MKKILFTREEAGELFVSIVNPASKESIERVLGPLSQAEYETHVWVRSVPTDAINPRFIDDEDLPATREFRNAWCDVTGDSRVDIDCSKAKTIVLEQLRAKRNEKLAATDAEFISKLSQGLATADIAAEKEVLRDLTEPLKAVDADGKFNDEEILEQLRQFSKPAILDEPVKAEITPIGDLSNGEEFKTEEPKSKS